MLLHQQPRRTKNPPGRHLPIGYSVHYPDLAITGFVQEKMKAHSKINSHKLFFDSDFLKNCYV